MKAFFIATLLILTAGSISGQTIYKNYQDGVIIFQLKTDKSVSIIPSDNGVVSISENTMLKSMDRKFDIYEVKQLYPNHPYNLLERTYQINFLNPSKVDSFIEEMSQFNDIEYAEKKELHQTFFTPNDTYYSNSTSNGQWALFQINAAQAWDISTGSSSTIVAVTDNAINVNHPDLTNKMLPGHDAVDNDNDPTGCGSNDGFHGSHVSGIVGAETNNGLGISSIGFDVSILPVKIGDCNGSLTAGYEGITWAADNGADVINMSWGGGGSSTYGQNVCNYAWNQGAILVAAAGNDGVNSVFYPAGYDNVVSVASTTTGDAKSSFSNYGSWIDISAPGSSILSTNSGTGYQVTQGTSMASPLVAGLVGLMKSHATGATNTDIINCLYNSADNIDGSNSNYVGQLGAGRINAYQAMVCSNSYAYQLDAGISEVSQPTGNLCNDTYTPELILRNFGSNTLTSATITYQVSGSTSQTYNWTGNLTTGQTDVITLPTITGNAGAYTLTASTSSPNGSTDQNSANDENSSSYTIIPNGDQVTLSLLTDCYGSEITWEIVDDQNNLVTTGGGYADVTGGQLETSVICLSPGCYTFNIADSYGDGLYGSQWSCTVNGDYSMQDGGGNTLFTMTAANGDFGDATSHTFCVSSPIPDDAGIIDILSPEGNYCNASIAPQVQLQNLGNQTLSSCTINYSNNSGSVQTFSWTGSLAPNQTDLISLPNISGSNGSNNFIAYTTSPNGNTDGNNLNDTTAVQYTVFTNGINLPFTEDFESGFTNQNWNITNGDQGITWELASISGTTPGTQAAKMDFYNYGQQGERDFLTTPMLDFSNQTSIDFYFEYAYRRYDQNSTDSLIVSISTDCGQTYTRLLNLGEDGTGSFATAYTNTASFTPAAGDWCMGTVGADCFTIDLSSYAGQSNVFIQFEGYNAGTNGNNLFIDNINITGDFIANCPDLSVTPHDANCFGASDGSVNLTVANGVAPITYSLDNINYGTSTSYNNLSEGAYRAYAKGADGCIDSVDFSINQPSQISISSTTTDATCGQSNGAVTISANGGTGSYEYSIDAGTTFGTNATFSNLSQGNITITVRDDNNCVVSSSSVINNTNSSFSLNTSGDQSICAGDAITISASGVPNGGSYSWNQNLGSGASHSVNPSGNISYTVTGTDAGGCSQSETINITVNDIPNVSITSTNNTICEGETTTLIASGAQTYTWNNGTSGSNLTVSPNSSTTYSVIGQTGSCSSSSVTYAINVNPLPTVSANASSTNVLINEAINFDNAGSNANDYDWSFGDGNSSMNASETHSYAASGTYIVTLTGDLNGCSSSDQITITVDSPSSINEEGTISIELYPNPTNGWITLKTTGLSEILELRTFDLQGKIVGNPVIINPFDGTLNLDFTSLSEGVYILNFNGEHGYRNERLTIVK